MNEIESNRTNIWREMKKAYQNKTNPIPTGVKNIKGKVVTNLEERKQFTLDHFDRRMRKIPINDGVKEQVELKNNLFNERLNKAKNNTSPSFTMKELDLVLKSLKKGKSKDPDRYICELFKEGVMGKDLKHQVD